MSLVIPAGCVVAFVAGIAIAVSNILSNLPNVFSTSPAGMSIGVSNILGSPYMFSTSPCLYTDPQSCTSQTTLTIVVALSVALLGTMLVTSIVVLVGALLGVVDRRQTQITRRPSFILAARHDRSLPHSSGVSVITRRVADGGAVIGVPRAAYSPQCSLRLGILGAD
jgi:hypothetical protein